MESLGFTTVSSCHRSSSPSSICYQAALFGSRRVRRLNVSVNLSSSWVGKSFSLSSSQKNVFNRELWGCITKKFRNVRRDRSFIVRAEMFGQLTSNLEAAWSKLKGEEVLTKENIAEPMRDIRRALLEADVSLPVVRRFVQSVSDQAVGVGLIRGVRPDQQLVKVELLEKLISNYLEKY